MLETDNIMFFWQPVTMERETATIFSEHATLKRHCKIQLENTISNLNYLVP